MRTLDHTAFAQIVKSYYALSFRISQGYPPLECIYNALFCQWLRQQFFFPEMSGEDIAQILPTLAPPTHHKLVRPESIVRINTYASRSFLSTWNALFCPEADSPYKQLCLSLPEISNELRTFDPADAVDLLEKGEKDELLEQGLQHFAGMDCKFLLYGRPRAYAEPAYESFVKEYVVFQKETRHEFFRTLMQCWHQKWLQQDIHNQAAIRYLGMAAWLWQQHHPGETFYPPQWPEELSYISR